MSSQHNNRINFFHEAAPYIQQHQDKTFVIGLSGKVLAHTNYPALLKDIGILMTLGIRLILVYGVRPQVDAQLETLNHTIEIINDLRITDDITLQTATQIIGQTRIDIENKLTQILSVPPTINNEIGILSGNLITAKPLGVIHGVDYQHTGEVRKINTPLIHTLLDHKNLILLPPLGFSPTGQCFNLRYEEVASFTAKAMKADKLIFIQESDLDLPKQTSKKELLAQLESTQGEKKRLYQNIVNALEQGVKRVHLLDCNIVDALLLELYTRDGIGALFSANLYENIHPATIEDVAGILALIQPLEKKGILVKRSREQIELEINNFIVIERDNKIIACAAYYPHKEERVAELACLAVHQRYLGQKRGDTLLSTIIEQCQQQGIKKLIILTTKTSDWFQERNFVLGQLNDLPTHKKQLYNLKRKSKIWVRML
ncbi:MAG: amino-acid N-acetyltransferase [Thiotrichaceae bacterium]|nr:amino-acid N-acetyltransferase [Thiotrichaceae bacterium]